MLKVGDKLLCKQSYHHDGPIDVKKIKGKYYTI